MAYIKVYEREIIDRRTYPSALAQSVHFSVSADGKSFAPLNNNTGILFPKAEIGEMDNIIERGAKDPKIFYNGGKYTVFAEYVNSDGEEVYPDKYWVWETDDMIRFDEIGLCPKDSFSQMLNSGYISDTAPISNSILQDLYNVYGNIHFTYASLPESVTVHDISEVDSIEAICHYSDGSCDSKSVIWNVNDVPQKGTFEVTGEIFQLEYPSPAVEGFADPVVFEYNGKKYFIATNDKTGCVGLFVSCADTVMGLFTNGNLPACILDYDEERKLCGTFWAPEFHVINGEIYILFAVSGKVWGPQSHLMKLKHGGDIMDPTSWEDPVRITKANGEYLVTGEGQITLDMTYFSVKDRHYYMWSQRTLSPVDSGSMIYIAETDPSHPERLISEPVLIARPLYGWENQSGTVNNEGPYPLIVDDTVYIAYSAAAAGGFSYSIGLLKADVSSDLLCAESWEKSITPALTAYDMNDIEGPGHNAFAYGDDGKLIITYHGQNVDSDNRRNTYLHRVHFDKYGTPRFDLIPERDLPKNMRRVSVKVTLI